MYQEITLIGNLGNDPEMRYLPSGQPVTSFSVATNRRWTDQQSGERKEEVTWWRVSVFGNQAEACNQYLSKGRQVFVVGRMRPDPNSGNPRIWTRQDGSPAASYDLTANTVQFLGGRGEGGAGSYTDAAETADVDADGIPF